MTENEIKEYIADLRNKADILRKSGFATNGVSNHFDKSADVIEELLSYRAIGTIGEFKDLKEKNTKKRFNIFESHGMRQFVCGCCDRPILTTDNYCSFCGQKLDWQ